MAKGMSSNVRSGVVSAARESHRNLVETRMPQRASWVQIPGLNIGFSLDISTSSRVTTNQEQRNVQLPPGTENEDHGEPIKDVDVVQRFLQQLESHRKKSTSFDGIPILGGIVKKIRRYQPCVTPKYDRGHCRWVRFAEQPLYLISPTA